MKESKIKSLLSYLTEVHLESVPSEYNDQLHVVLKNGRYQLCTENAIYSYGDKYDNFRKCFKKMQLPDSSGTKVLLLGYGMGSIPYMLEKVFMKNYRFTGVEIDPMVIYLASKYVLPELSSEISIIETDAATFVEQNEELFDIICIDIFIDDNIPPYFLTESFLMNVKEIIKESGVILFNHLGYTSLDVSKSKQYFETVFSKIFFDSTMIKVHKNIMMISKRDVVNA
ncbi:MAG: fused MFS/spermidine synthase [Saprospiraceae bacterium]|nr:fused MFS/spermidine synthase [Saprospiraceae bacterium]